jgi:hypothetical protein
MNGGALAGLFGFTQGAIVREYIGKRVGLKYAKVVIKKHKREARIA